MTMRRILPLLFILPLLMLGACDDLPSWIGGPKAPVKRAPGTRIDVMTGQGSLKPDDAVKDVTVEVPEQAALDSWISRNQAMATGHIGLTGITHHEDASIGEGKSFSQPFAPSPIVVDGLVIAMDAQGAISAHETGDISKIRWVNMDGRERRSSDVMGGGFATHEGVLFATSGYGKLLAIDLKSGKLVWKTNVGAPVRGAPAVGAGIVAVLTADDQTLAFDETKGTPRWSHRGIREQAGYFSVTAPVVSDDGIVVTVYNSGEIFALRADSGAPLWSDTVTAADKTLASDVFTGIDADPIVQDGVVVVTSASGTMQASALLNGRPLWQAHVGSHQTPWSAGNALFVLSAGHDIAAVFKRDGTVRWAKSLTELDTQGKDATPPLYGPILAANAVLVVNGAGTLMTFRPQDGEHLHDYELAKHIVTPPVVAGGALYLVSQDATLHKYY